MREITVHGTQFWIAVALVIVAIVVDDVQDAIDRVGNKVAQACQVDQRPHAEARRP